MDSVQNWQAGDIAVITEYGVETRAVLRPDCPSHRGLHWCYFERTAGGSDWTSRVDVAGRPLAVIDPESADVERLQDLFWQNQHHSGLAMQAALREFASPTPWKPDEPKSYLAVVQVADGRRYWRWSAGDAHTGWPWRLLGAVHADTEDDGNFRWDDLAVVEVVSWGVEVPS